MWSGLNHGYFLSAIRRGPPFRMAPLWVLDFSECLAPIGHGGELFRPAATDKAAVGDATIEVDGDLTLEGITIGGEKVDGGMIVADRHGVKSKVEDEAIDCTECGELSIGGGGGEGGGEGVHGVISIRRLVVRDAPYSQKNDYIGGVFWLFSLD